MQVTKSFGALPDQDHGDPAKDPDISKLKLVAKPLEKVSWRQHAPDVVDQGNTSTCVGQAVAGAWCTQVRAETGELVPRGSSLVVYAMSIHQYDQAWPKVDIGTYARTATLAIEKHGIPPESAWPFESLKVGEEPPASALSQAFGWRGPRGHYRIHGEGDRAIDQCIAALQAKRIIVISVPVDHLFIQDDDFDHAVWPQIGEHVGNHAMYVVGYKKDQFGIVWFETINSWGQTWQVDGTCWLEQGWISEGAFDRWVLDF